MSEETEQEKTEEKKGLFQRLASGLSRTRANLASNMDGVFSGASKIDEAFYEDLEEVLLLSDLGVHATEDILDDLREKTKAHKIKDPAACRQLLIESIRDQMRTGEIDYRFEKEPSVVLVIGVNGVGKTTTIGKLAAGEKARGRRILLCAADTFRAAAGEQLDVWAKRAGAEIVGGQEGSDPASVVFDAAQAARARNADVLFVDTAGRLHNKKNLMEELNKIDRILTRECPDRYRETLLVLDATTGQNALQQAREFSEAAAIDGIVLTKMDGTAKGGIAVAIQAEFGIPVKYIGVGESADDLQKFDADAFVEALFAENEEKA